MRGYVSPCAVLGAIAWLAAAPPALAQAWEIETLPDGRPAAALAQELDRLALECAVNQYGDQRVSIVYHPADFLRLALQDDPSGEGEFRSRPERGWVFLRIDGRYGIPQRAERIAGEEAYRLTDLHPDVIEVLRAGDRLDIAPSRHPEPLLGRFTLAGAAAAIDAVMQACGQGAP